ncbi:hypothetical protein, conserved in T. vivax [Trypanosoma vivax Y486]|uniref:Uncharacterized protein n=1 Tax=Trypanosoma vivax (strain Y486) TaxID=1055687 RepID=F9WKK9_TRYVY|nr:hypothetical protein, conserved in T. vivax [Trypanosoma vivax Y486]|eukprot:CCD18030.1 hypothetical protein, conserved in T. vivax [Trypanosoma vivax Y486]
MAATSTQQHGSSTLLGTWQRPAKGRTRDAGTRKQAAHKRSSNSAKGTTKGPRSEHASRWGHNGRGAEIGTHRTGGARQAATQNTRVTRRQKHHGTGQRRRTKNNTGTWEGPKRLAKGHQRGTPAHRTARMRRPEKTNTDTPPWQDAKRTQHAARSTHNAQRKGTAQPARKDARTERTETGNRENSTQGRKDRTHTQGDYRENTRAATPPNTNEHRRSKATRQHRAHSPAGTHNTATKRKKEATTHKYDARQHTHSNEHQTGGARKGTRHEKTQRTKTRVTQALSRHRRGREKGH